MLDGPAKELLRQRGLHTLHDHLFSSLLYGEPFLDDGMTCYFDGRYLTLCAFPLRGDASKQDRVVAQWVRRWVQLTGAEAMMLVAPSSPDLRALEQEGMHRFHTWRARLNSRELIANCPDPQEISIRRFRRALRNTFVLRLTRGGEMDFAKLKLIERFQGFTGVTPYLAGLTTAWPAILMDCSAHFIEAWHGSALKGFVALHEAFDGGGLAMAMARERDAVGVADFLFANMLAYGRTIGLKWINLGSSVTRGQYAFKLKWGSPSPLPPYILTEWRRPALARRRFLLWGPRTMQKSAS